MTHENEDLSTLRLKLKEEDEEQSTTIYIHNVYILSPGSYSSQNSFKSLTNAQEKLETPGEHILLKDFIYIILRRTAQADTYHRAADGLLNIIEAEDVELLLPERIGNMGGHGSDHISILNEFELKEKPNDRGGGCEGEGAGRSPCASLINKPARPQLVQQVCLGCCSVFRDYDMLTATMSIVVDINREPCPR